MYIRESLKKTFATVTGMNKPSTRSARGSARPRKPRTMMFKDDGHVPNNPRLPFICYRGAVTLTTAQDPAAVFEELFAANGWGDSWRNGIYDHVHYHSHTHEVLGIARGKARVRFGGDSGKILELAAGNVAVLPAGTGHQRISASDDFLVVGAYPASSTYDECTGSANDHERALKSIPKVAVPAKDPVYGPKGPCARFGGARACAPRNGNPVSQGLMTRRYVNVLPTAKSGLMVCLVGNAPKRGIRWRLPSGPGYRREALKL